MQAQQPKHYWLSMDGSEGKEVQASDVEKRGV
jgi:hypothetical protein